MTVLPDQFLTADDYEEMEALGASVDVLAEIFLEARQPGTDPKTMTTDTLRMAAAAFRAGATRFELIADRVDAGAV